MRNGKRDVRSKKLEAGRWVLAGCVVAVAGGVISPVWGQVLQLNKLVQSVSGGSGGPAQSEPAPLWPKKAKDVLVISGVKTEMPALQWSLLPTVEETEKGNAATKYLAAIDRVPNLTADEQKVLDDGLAADLSKLDVKDERFGPVTSRLGEYVLLREGSRLDSADWETNVRRKGMLAALPSLGGLRQITNGLALRVRLDIKRHDWLAAQDKLKTGYMLARHLGEGETLIESLVGVAIASRMNQCVEDWVSEPGSPNLFWPLANLPPRFNDLRRPLSFERAMVYVSLPAFKEMKEGRYSPEEWDRLWFGAVDMQGMMGPNVSLASDWPMWKQQTVGVVTGMGFYTEAKRFLIERGMTPETAEKMPVAEALGRYFVRSYDESADEMFKWMGLPPAQALPGMKEAEAQIEKDGAANRLNILAAIFLPSLRRAVETSVRTDRQIAALRIVEALRAYAGEKGELPGRLEDVKLPLPVDPLGQPFEYEKKGNTAVLTSAKTERPGDMVRYELTLRK